MVGFLIAIVSVFLSPALLCFFSFRRLCRLWSIANAHRVPAAMTKRDRDRVAIPLAKDVRPTGKGRVFDRVEAVAAGIALLAKPAMPRGNLRKRL